MKRILLAAAAAAALMGMPAMAQTQTDSTQTMASMENVSAEQFVTMAASSDMFEIQSSKAAETMAQNSDVKEFAEHMIKDHTKSSKMLMQNAKQSGVTPPTAMIPDHAAMLTKVTGMSGADFDKAYVDAQVMAHENAVALFTAYSQNGEDANLKAFAAKTLPTLKEHLESVQALQSKVSS